MNRYAESHGATLQISRQIAHRRSPTMIQLTRTHAIMVIYHRQVAASVCLVDSNPQTDGTATVIHKFDNPGSRQCWMTYYMHHRAAVPTA